MVMRAYLAARDRVRAYAGECGRARGSVCADSLRMTISGNRLSFEAFGKASGAAFAEFLRGVLYDPTSPVGNSANRVLRRGSWLGAGWLGMCQAPARLKAWQGLADWLVARSARDQVGSD